MQWDGKQMAALAAAADSGSFEQAAAQLRITPSAVSQRIRALEEAAGALLLSRSPLPPDRARPAAVALLAPGDEFAARAG